MRKTGMYLQNDGWRSRVQHHPLSEESLTTRCGIRSIGTVRFVEVAEALHPCVSCRQIASDEAPKRIPIHKEAKPAKHPAKKTPSANEQIEFSMF
jgi:hypothetical protein